MEKRILFCATVDFHFSSFHLPYMKWFKEQGWEVHVASSGNIDLPFLDKKFTIPIERSPFKINNLLAYQELKKIINENQYKLLHCHTPMGGVLARLAARTARKKGTKVIYTAHGFHFCKGSPMINWLLYYPIEKYLAAHTDCLITINQEDYELANRRGFKATTIEHVHGVGVDTELFKPIEDKQKQKLRLEYGFKESDCLLFYAAEFNKNKNQKLLLQVVALLKEEVPNIRLLLAGNGPMLTKCQSLAKRLGITENVNFLGYRNDIGNLLKISDLAVASSFREGLPVNIMEAMACGLPVLATKNRGHLELVKNDINGWIIHPDQLDIFKTYIKRLANDSKLRNTLGLNGRQIILSTFSKDKIIEEKSYIYHAYMGEMEGEKWAVQ